MATSKANRLYAPQFRRQMVELVRSGRKPEALAREFEPSAQAIRSWVAQADRDEGRRADGLTSVERQELSRRRRENRQLKLEHARRPIRPRGPLPPSGRISCGSPTSPTCRR